MLGRTRHGVPAAATAVFAAEWTSGRAGNLETAARPGAGQAWE